MPLGPRGGGFAFTVDLAIVIVLFSLVVVVFGKLMGVARIVVDDLLGPVSRLRSGAPGVSVVLSGTVPGAGVSVVLNTTVPVACVEIGVILPGAVRAGTVVLACCDESELVIVFWTRDRT